MASSTPIVLVTGATGDQGGATARLLVSYGCKVRALVRNPLSDAAVELQKLNIELYKGDFDDKQSMVRALTGATGLFLNTSPSMQAGVERQQAQNALQAATLAGTVVHVVYTSVATAGEHESFPNWGVNHPLYEYWISKHQNECAVRNGDFKFWTIFRPAVFMGNFLNPKAKFMFPNFKENSLVTTYRPETRLALVDEGDIGLFAAAAFMEPQTYNRKEIDLGVEALTIEEVVAALNRASGKHIKVEYVEYEEGSKRGIFPMFLESQKWCNEVGYKVDYKKLQQYPIKMSTFSEYLKKHEDRVKETFA